ncbi:MAG: arsenate reductase (glutaredoxin) [Gammaproteobacteria bacterium]
MATTIYHNPRCSKSRQTLQLLNDNNVNADIIEYLKTPPDAQTLKDILSKLGIQPRQLMRTKEAIYKELNLDDESLTDDQLINAMIENPKLIERPIVVKDGKVAVGRPPENVLSIL